MGLSGYIAATDEAERYQREMLREDKLLPTALGPVATPIADLLKPYGVTAGEAALVATALHRQPKECRKFILRFKHGLQAPDPRRPMRSALTIGGSYVLCGMIPLLPYMVLDDLHQALLISIVMTLLALAVFGFVKGRLTRISGFRCAWQTALIGSLAAGIAFGIARIIA